MKLNQIPKKEPFQLPTEAHFEKLRRQVFEKIEEKPTKTLSLWVRPHIQAFAASFILLLVAMAGLYVFTNRTTSTDASHTLMASTIDLSKIPTEELTTFLLEEEISESELLAFLPEETQFSVFSDDFVAAPIDIENLDGEDIDLLLEDYY